ncbi:hypothetical protein [Curtobacterium sp. L1-20]|uniref:hypothetical protein n=1 Tax=Curtobacterium sp. L1-20 TaxID=3138181 RepID=UPI003B5242B3
MNDPVAAVPPAIATVLLAARAAENSASGPDRRDAFRTTRHLLGGCRVAGIPLEDLAALFQVRADTIRNRAYVDGLVPAATFVDLARVSLDDLTGWQRDGLLPAASTDPGYRTSYPASALITALITNATGVEQ